MDSLTSNKLDTNVRRAAVLQLLAERGWISLNQFSQLIGLSYPTVLRLKTCGHIRTVRVGGVYRISVEEYNRFTREGNINEPNYNRDEHEHEHNNEGQTEGSE